MKNVMAGCLDEQSKTMNTVLLKILYRQKKIMLMPWSHGQTASKPAAHINVTQLSIQTG